MKPLASMLFACAALLAAAAPADEPIGLVVGLQGEAQAVSSSGAARSLAMKSPIHLHDTLRTGPGAKLQIMFNDDTLFSQGENAEVVINEYVFNPAAREECGFFLRVAKGLVRIVTGRITDLNPDRFKVKTGRATIGIRGCELGFRAGGGDFDQIYVVRVPAGKRISILPEGGAETLLREPGWVRVWDGGRTQRGLLEDKDLKELSLATTPQSEEEEGAPPPAGGPSVPGFPEADEEESEPPGEAEEIGEPGFDDPQLPIDEMRDEDPPGRLDPPPPAPDQTPDAIVPPPLRIMGGGGIGGTYASVGPNASLTRLHLYHNAAGTIANGMTSVRITGQAFDGAGNYLGEESVAYENVPLTVFGGQTSYEGYRTAIVSPGVKISNDNLQQFVVRTDDNDSLHRLTFWGYPSETFQASGLQPGSVFTYDVHVCDYPGVTPGPHDPASEVRPAELRVNTRTGTFIVRGTDGVPHIGRLDGLQFFGQESQGVGVMSPTPITGTAHAEANVGSSMAGFMLDGSERTAETGGWTYQGYATGFTAPTDYAGANRAYSSAYTMVDDPNMNEGRVRITLDRGAYQDNVQTTIGVFENPSLPTTTDVALNNPAFSGFIEGNDFGAIYESANQHVELVNRGSGADWVWGEWNGDREVDLGGGVTGHEDVHGDYVAGQTLTPAQFSALITGTSGYMLHTPAGSPGHAVGNITMPNYVSRIEGTALLNVFIPGSGGPANWGGTFDLAGMNGDSLQIMLTARPFTANGHLNAGVPDSYDLQANGGAYPAATLVTSEMTGNLVGPGTGLRPITGAIGSGSFEHAGNVAVNITYGADLVP